MIVLQNPIFFFDKIFLKKKYSRHSDSMGFLEFFYPRVLIFQNAGHVTDNPATPSENPLSAGISS
jgi:hypothetical protein